MKAKPELRTGKITRREWLRFMSHTVMAVCICLAVPYSAFSTGVPVFDAALASLGIEQKIVQAKQLLQEIQQLEQQATMVRQNIQSLANQAQNLQRLPGSILNDLMGSGNKITGILSAANRIGFEANSVQSQFDSYYNQAVQLGNAPDAIRTRLNWFLARQDTEQTSLKTTSIANDLAQKYQQIQALLTFSFGGKGNLDAQQITHQIEAAQADIQLQRQTMEAAMARTQLQAQAEEMALQRARLELGDQATTYLNLSIPYAAQGRVIDYRQWYLP